VTDTTHASARGHRSGGAWPSRWGPPFRNAHRNAIPFTHPRPLDGTILCEGRRVVTIDWVPSSPVPARSTPLRLSGQQFAELLAAGGAYERMVESEACLVLVDGDDLPDVLDPPSMETLATLAGVVVGLVADPGVRKPAWADVVLSPGDAALESVVETVGSNPLASTSLALLLRSSRGRSTSDGLIAESVTYGLLQGGPEFARWRSDHPVRERRPEPESPVEVSRIGEQLSIVLNRPQVRNAFNAAMRDALLAALHLAEVDDSIATVAIRGNGDAFCSGGDLDEFGTRPDPVTAHLVRLSRNVGRSLAFLSHRTTVRIHGAAVGSGIELAAFAHRVVASRSTRISLPEVHLGLIPGAGGTVSVTRRIGRHATMLLALGLPSIGAQTALEWGLVDELED
jgi:hypothetical protein